MEDRSVQESPVSWPTAPPVIVLAGPTGVGKTAAAMEIAERIHGEIVNADSMQIYRGMDIGVAKPGSVERARVPFHLLDLVNPDRQYTVSEWKLSAERAVADIASRGMRPIVCGGTGLYIRALLDDWSLAQTPPNVLIRNRLMVEAETTGTHALHARLMTVDRLTAERLHPNDAMRIVRALEVFEATGLPISFYQKRDRDARASRYAIRLGLTMSRDVLNHRINARVDAMIAAGLEREVRTLLESGYSPELGALRSLGYKEMVGYLRGDMSLAAAIDAIKMNTRRFAKRQQTWFRADPLIDWIDGTAMVLATDALLERVNAARPQS